MTFSEAVWNQASEAFGKRRGFPEALTPYSRTWRTVIERAEHALWLWNDKYGPLNPRQREYASQVVCSALSWSQSHPPDQRYARFHASLTAKLNHERVHEAFLQRADKLPETNLLVDLGTMRAVPA